MQGLSARLIKEIQLNLQPSTLTAAVSAPEYMPSNTFQHAVWFGGAVLSKVWSSTPAYS